MCMRVSNKKNMNKKKFVSLKSLKKGVGSGSISQRYGSLDPIHTKMSRIPNTVLKSVLYFWLCAGNDTDKKFLLPCFLYSIAVAPLMEKLLTQAGVWIWFDLALSDPALSVGLCLSVEDIRLLAHSHPKIQLKLKTGRSDFYLKTLTIVNIQFVNPSLTH